MRPHAFLLPTAQLPSVFHSHRPRSTSAAPDRAAEPLKSHRVPRKTGRAFVETRPVASLPHPSVARRSELLLLDDGRSCASPNRLRQPIAIPPLHFPDCWWRTES